jgi:hypothetical protein
MFDVFNCFTLFGITHNLLLKSISDQRAKRSSLERMKIIRLSCIASMVNLRPLYSAILFSSWAFLPAQVQGVFSLWFLNCTFHIRLGYGVSALLDGMTQDCRNVLNAHGNFKTKCLNLFTGTSRSPVSSSATSLSPITGKT